MRLIIVGFALLLIGANASAQATRPSDSWTGVVEELQRALGESDAGAMVKLMSDDVDIACFDSRQADAVRLMARTRRAELVFARTYQQVPANLASELSDVIRNVRVPEEVRNQLVLRDEAHGKRANTTAAEWLGASLSLRPHEQMAVVVLWCEHPATPMEPAQAELVFILLKGTAEKDKPAKITRVVYGDPQRAGR